MERCMRTQHHREVQAAWLDWLENPALRRRCYAGSDRGEQRHFLIRVIYTLHQGRVVDCAHDALQFRRPGMNLVIAALVD
ncbi:Tn3 family transposase [Croceicoccus esteveae]|uniref:Tn3 family transposase n=1 Tax=Croceicoccus esteveae TaxID=3075597 RepID=UPI003D77B9EA